MNETKDQDNHRNEDSSKKLCPFVANPRDDCYCFDMKSSKVRQAVHYCLRNFEECKIYRRALKEDHDVQNSRN